MGLNGKLRWNTEYVTFRQTLDDKDNEVMSFL